MSYLQFLRLLKENESFRQLFINELANDKHTEGYFFEVNSTSCRGAWWIQATDYRAIHQHHSRIIISIIINSIITIMIVFGLIAN